MIRYKSPEDIEQMRPACRLVGEAHAAVASLLLPGMRTREIDQLVETFICDHGATPSFKNYHGFPYATCISMNAAVVHGFPGEQELQEGDVFSLDIGVYWNGFHGDSAYTYAIGEVPKDVQQLLRVTKESLYMGIAKARAGNRLGDIGFAIQEHTEKKYGYGVVREMVGHGLGRDLHEEPQVPNYGRKGSGPLLKPGLVLAIEPMINLGTRDIIQLEDGWTILTRDGKPSAHYEHDVLITTGEPEILTSFTAIEAAEQKNPNLFWSHQSS